MGVRAGGLVLAAACAALGLAAARAAETPAGAGGGDLRFSKLNRTYTDFAPGLAEYDEGGVRVTLTSPRQVLVLRDNRIQLAPAAGDLWSGAVELDVQGKATMIVDLALGPIAERFTEEVLIPPQTIAIAGKARLKRIEGGYEITPVELPAKFAVAVQSRTVNSMLSLCDQAAILSLGSIDCGGIERALTRPEVPLPSGQSFTLQDSELTDEDRRALDALLASR